MKTPTRYNAVTELRTAHDVRRLRSCEGCDGIGDDRSMIERVISLHQSMHWHGRCFIARRGVEQFLALPKSETDKLTLDDIGVATMMRLLKR